MTVTANGMALVGRRLTMTVTANGMALVGRS